MVDNIADAKPDRRPAIVICAYEPDDTSWDPVEDLSGRHWSPPGARTVAVAAQDPEQLAAVLTRHLRESECRAVLLVGRNRRSDVFRLQMRAENRALTGGAKLTRTGPAVARATAPIADMVRALHDAGLAADASSDGEEDVGDYLLYSLLADLSDDADAPAIGLLRAPSDISLSTVQKGVKAAAGAIARHLSPLPHARHS